MNKCVTVCRSSSINRSPTITRFDEHSAFAPLTVDSQLTALLIQFFLKNYLDELEKNFMLQNILNKNVDP